MNLGKRKEKIKTGTVSLAWVAFSALVEGVFFIVWLVFKTKTAIVLLGISTLLLGFWLLVFIVWFVNLKV